ncbi:MAG: PEP/pyruvate-binding domain-containing protein, partial [Candidatus Nanohaloarchaea archaeon]|nr:PEP/pyruvate-binding domain-containing protein [Candidatus Nanohaloarchaea archaeon]
MVRWLEDIDRDDSNTVGSKASNLGELLTQGLDVPRAFVVEADTFDDFLQSSGIKERIESEIAACNVEDHDQLRETSQTIQRRIDNAGLAGETEEELTTAYEEIDLNNSVRQAGNKAVELVGGQRENESVVVRSSPVGGREHGVHTPEIGVRGKDDLIEAVKEAWKRYYSPEALYYRQKKGGSDGMAVMVQKMVKADTSCTVFTRHPVGDDNTILIEAVYGIGTALSDGTATPDTFVVDRETGRLQEREVREKHWNISRDPSTGKIQKQRVKRSKRDERTLDSQELSSIVNTALDIEERVGSALKIDFSIGRSKRFILDVARASTARSSGQEAKGNELLTGVVAAPGTREGEIAITYDTEALVDPDENIVVSVNPDTALLTSLDRLNGII